MAHIVPQRLRALRREANEVQEDLAAVIEKDRAMISNFERGLLDPMLDDLVKIARHYNVSPDYLLGWSDVRLPVKGQQAGHHIDEGTLLTAVRRALSEVNGPPDLLRLEGPTSGAKRTRPRKGDDNAA